MTIDNNDKSNQGGSPPQPPENKDKKDAPMKSSSTSCQSATEGSPAPALETGVARKLAPKLIDETVKVDVDTKQRVKVISRFMPVIDYQECLKELGIHYRTHAFLGVQVSVDKGKTWQCGNKELDAAIYDKVLRCVNFRVPKGKNKDESKPANFPAMARTEAIYALLHKNTYNPLKKWIDGLPTERCDEAESLLGRIFRPDIEDEYEPDHIKRYFCDLLMLIVKGIIMRAMMPGCSFPFFPIFVGEQGCGKSFGLQLILPPWIADDAFVDSLDMSLPAKEKEQILRDSALVECSELAGRNRQQDVAEHKSFVSTKSSKIRLPYARYPEQVLRRAIIIGTSNDDECLPVDPTGDRRTIIVPVARNADWSNVQVETELPKVMDEWRDKLFSHGKWLLEQGQGCSYSWWADSSREMRVNLVERAEKRSYWLELAIDEIAGCHLPYKDTDGMPDGVARLEEIEKQEGIPLFLPIGSYGRSIMKMIKNNNAKSNNLPRNLSAKLVGSTLLKKGWIKSRKRFVGTDNPIAHYRPPRSK